MPGYPGAPSVQTVADKLASLTAPGNPGNVAGYYVYLRDHVSGTIYESATPTDSGGNWSIASVPAGTYQYAFGLHPNTQYPFQGSYLVALNPTPSPFIGTLTGRGRLVPESIFYNSMPSELPTVMPNPPTVTLGVLNAASVIASSTLVPWTSSLFTYTGAKVILAPEGQPNWGRGLPPAGAGTNASYFVDFMFYGSKFEWYTNPFYDNFYRLRVNGQLATPGISTGNAIGNGAYLNLFDFGTAAVRRITFELTALTTFGGVRIGPTDTVWQVEQPKALSTLFMGDSVSQGAGSGNSPLTAFPYVTAALLGWGNTYTDGIGGTGYLNNNTNYQNFRQRLNAYIIGNYTPDIWITEGGGNDSSFATAAAIQAEAITYYQAVYAAFPKVRQYAVVWNPNNNPSALIIGANNAVKAACLATGVTFIDLFNPYWITGTGNTGALTGSGNADIFIGPDAVHPSVAGHIYLGHRLAQAVLAAESTAG